MEKEPTQRKSLFKTTCKIQGKCCKVIIDSSSIDNMVYVEMVENLNLMRLPHPTPYKVSWLNKGEKVFVNEKNRVDFHIGGCKDRILCVVIPMDVCDVLFGRPWQFYRYAKNDGRRKVYEIEKDGVSYTLTQFKDEAKGKYMESNVLMVGRKEFIKTRENEEMDLTAIPNPSKVMKVVKVVEWNLRI